MLLVGRKKNSVDALFCVPNDAKYRRALEKEREFRAKAAAEQQKLDAEVEESVEGIPAAIGNLVLATLYGGDWRQVHLASLVDVLQSAQVEVLPTAGTGVRGMGKAAYYRRLCESAPTGEGSSDGGKAPENPVEPVPGEPTGPAQLASAASSGDPSPVFGSIPDIQQLGAMPSSGMSI